MSGTATIVATPPGIQAKAERLAQAVNDHAGAAPRTARAATNNSPKKLTQLLL
jgi:hypothetical protein